MQAAPGAGRAGYGLGVRLALAVALWALTLLGHDAFREGFYAVADELGLAAMGVLRWAGVALLVATALVVARRVGPRSLVPVGLAAVLTAGGATPGEVLHVAQYGLFAALGGPPWAWLGAALVDEAWEARADSPFDLGDVILDGVGVYVAHALRHSAGGARPGTAGQLAARSIQAGSGAMGASCQVLCDSNPTMAPSHTQVPSAVRFQV